MKTVYLSLLQGHLGEKVIFLFSLYLFKYVHLSSKLPLNLFLKLKKAVFAGL